MRIVWSKLALDELHSAIADSEEVDPLWADALLLEADEVESLLLRHPKAGPVVDALGARKLRLGRLPFVIIYDVGPSRIEILRLHHAKADWRA